MIDNVEIVQTIEHLQRTFEDLMLRGLKAAGPGEINTLTNIREECERIGAYHLASRVGAIVEAIQSGSRTGAEALMKAQTSLRLFDRILTLDAAREALIVSDMLTATLQGTGVLEAIEDDGDDDDET
jgi:hypothetical protein